MVYAHVESYAAVKWKWRVELSDEVALNQWHRAPFMAYDLHIERAGERPIALNEWRAAVEATAGVRLFTAAVHTATNPRTGATVSFRAREGDTEF